MHIAAPGDPLEEGQETEQLCDRQNKQSRGRIRGALACTHLFAQLMCPAAVRKSHGRCFVTCCHHTHTHTRLCPSSLCRGSAFLCVGVCDKGVFSALHKVVPPFPRMLCRQRQLWQSGEQKCGGSDLPTVANLSQKASESCFSQSCRCVYRTVVSHTDIQEQL